MSLLEDLQSLDYLEEERPLVEKEKVRRAKVKIDLEDDALLQEVSWRQKSKVTWLKGDNNTGFIHHLAKSHKRNNFITNLCIDDTITSDQKVINDTII